jgi:hypothetical protein
VHAEGQPHFREHGIKFYVAVSICVWWDLYLKSFYFLFKWYVKRSMV